MSEKRSVYGKSGSGDDSDEETRDDDNNASNSGSGNSSGSESEDDTASHSSINSSARGRSSRGSHNHHSSDAADAFDGDEGKKRTTEHLNRSVSRAATGSPKIGDETQQSNNSRTNGGISDDNSDSESNTDTSSSGSDSNDNHESEDEAEGKEAQNELSNIKHNTSGTSVTSSSTTTTNTTTISNTSNTANNYDNDAEISDVEEPKNANNRSDAGDVSNIEYDEEKESDNELSHKSDRKTSKLSSIAKTADHQHINSELDEDKESGKDSDAESTKSSVDDDAENYEEDEDDEVESPTESSSSSSEDDEDDYQPKRSTRQVRRPPPSQEKTKRTVKKKRKQNWDSDESNESDEEEDSDDSVSHKRRTTTASSKSRQKQQHSRGTLGSRKKKIDDSEESEDDGKRCGTRRNAAAVSYKEASDVEKTDSEDLLDYEYDESQAEAAAAAATLEEEDKSETIERILAQRNGKKGCTGNQTTIYAMEENEEHSNKITTITEAATATDNQDSENTEVQYLIKWKGWSYIHNTWESEETLREQKAKGMKKLENFIKKEQDIEYWRRYAGPEDIDYFECQLELQNELLKSYNNVDRIIARNKKEDNSCEYLCKWQSLPYAESTWEDASLVLQKWQQCVDHFEDRENSKCTPSRQCKVLRHRPKFYRIKNQPEFLPDNSLKLRDYQLDGLNWLLHSWCKENSVILADEMGLGKTIQTICFLYSLFKMHHLYGPFLCVVPLSTMTAWQREFQLWAPDLNVVTYLGDVKSREMIRQYEWQFDGSKRLKFNCILTTYEIVLKDKLFLGTLQWAALLVDEAHRLKNDDSLLYKSLKEFETNHRLLITGTPLQNSLKELWALLHFIMPEKFLTWEDFESEHGNAADKGYTKLHQQLEPFILRRVKKDVEKSLPAKVEQILRVEMTSVQKQYYKWILTKNFDALRKGKRGSTSTFLNIVIELKKCCNHAALIRPSEFELMGMQQEEALQTLLKGSGKMVLLDKLLCRLRDTGHRVLIFSQMVRMLDVLSDYLQKRHFPFQRLDGSIKGEMRRQALDHFNAEGSQDFCFLLSTRAGGLGINLATADTVIIFDSDWNPQNDLQAQARAHRIGQKNQVNIYRLVTARSVEEQIVERAKQKMVLDHLVIQRMDTTGRTVLDKSGGSSTNSNPFDKDDLSAILKFGAEELFKDEQENDDELVCDIDEILRRAETRNEDPEMPGDDLLSAFKVASIVAFEEEPDAMAKSNNSPENDIEEDTKDWDDIIPEDFRKIVEEKERAKEMEDLYLPPRRKTTTNSQLESTPTKRGKRSQHDDSGDSDYEIGSDASGEGADGRNKRRGRPAMKEKINGFTDAELRRFIRSYRKFPAPLLRLEAIACDAELQEKPLAELKRIGEMLHDRCVQFLEEHKEEAPPPPPPAVKTANGANEETATKQKRNRATYSIKLGGVSFNAKTLLTSEEELKPLNEIIPSSSSERLSWSLDLKTRPANFDTEWGSEEDSKLLCGIYQYGIGSWEQMKMDPELKLTDKILFNDTRKPQAKHLQSRAEYLLKIIKKNLELKKKGPKGGRQRKPRKPKDTKNNDANAANTTPESRTRHLSETHGTNVGDAASLSTTSCNARSENEQNDNLSNDVDSNAVGNSSAKKKRKSNAGGKTSKGAKKTASDKGKKTNKPMHFTANNEPRALDVLGDLDPTIFNECKEKMRPVKRALKALDRPDSNLTNQEQVKHTRECLLSIGKQIDSCLEAYNEADKKVWRSNLWYFVSKFTEYDAKKLFKLYKSLKETTKTKVKKSKDAAQHSPAKSSSQSPAKKTKESKKNIKSSDTVRTPNGVVSSSSGKDKNKSKEKEKDQKISKKKKKDKDRNLDVDVEKTKTSTTTVGDRFTAKGAGADPGYKSQRFDTAQPHKRKHEAASDINDSKSFKRLNNDSRSGRDRFDVGHKRKHEANDLNDSKSFNHINSDGRSGRDRFDALQSPKRKHEGSDINDSKSFNRMNSESRRYPPNVPPQSHTGGMYRGDMRYPHGSNDWSPRDSRRDYSPEYRRGGHHRGNRDRRPEKRRYPPSHPLNYSGHYVPPIPPNFYMVNGVPSGPLPPPSHVGGMFRGDMRYPHGSNDWSSHESRMDYSPEYRRGTNTGGGGGSGGNSGDYDRRQQT